MIIAYHCLVQGREGALWQKYMYLFLCRKAMHVLKPGCCNQIQICMHMYIMLYMIHDICNVLHVFVSVRAV